MTGDPPTLTAANAGRRLWISHDTQGGRMRNKRVMALGAGVAAVGLAPGRV